MADENLSKNMKVLRKDIKRAKLFAIQYLTRRVKMLRNKRGTEKQVEKNARKAGRFEKELEYIKELGIEIVFEKIENKDLNYLNMTDIEDIQERSLARIISSKPIQKYLEKSKNTNDEKEMSTNYKDTECRASETTKGKATTNNVKSRKRQKKKGSSHYNQEPADVFDSSSDNDLTPSGIEQTVSSFFVESLSSMKDHGTTRQNRKSLLVHHDGNLSRELSKGKGKKDKQKNSSNRMGQRARQRLWKEKYGSKAKHFMTSKKMRKEENRMEQQKIFAKRKENLMQEVSHPSWEASKRRKMQQNISKTNFQGQKITFQDSD